MSEAENLLEVRHLKQYFGKHDFKTVDDVSFTVKKGEVVGIVGESGCGKTTTGRSIIRLNNATSGDVYFKGQRIVAGTRSYTDAIAQARLESKARPETLKQAGDTAGIQAEKARLKAFIAQQREEIRNAKNDHKNCVELYRKRLEAGNFYGIQFLGYTLVRLFSFRKDRFDDRKDYFTHCTEKEAKQKDQGKSVAKWIMLHVGLGCLVLSVVFAFVFYQMR